MPVWRERTIEKFYLRSRTSESFQMSKEHIRKTQDNADLPVLVALIRLVSRSPGSSVWPQFKDWESVWSWEQSRTRSQLLSNRKSLPSLCSMFWYFISLLFELYILEIVIWSMDIVTLINYPNSVLAGKSSSENASKILKVRGEEWVLGTVHILH